MNTSKEGSKYPENVITTLALLITLMISAHVPQNTRTLNPTPETRNPKPYLQGSHPACGEALAAPK